MTFKYTIGNRKIGRDTLIFNMGPAKSCPSKKLGLCKIPAGKCYALKAERMYPQVLPYRRAQARYWKQRKTTYIIQDLLAALNKHKKIKYIRFNESGDFYDQNSVDKLVNIAQAVKIFAPGIIIYGYTARKDLNFSRRPANLVISGSGFGVDNCFKAVKAYTQRDEFMPYSVQLPARCPGSCRTCKLCKIKSGRVIENLYH